jgi:lysophospholipase L1-like esterase
MGETQVYLQLAPGDACVLRTFTKEIQGRPWQYQESAGEPWPIPGTWKVRFTEGGPALPAAYETDNLASWTTRSDPEAKRFAGTAVYTLEFDAAPRDDRQWRLDLGRVGDSARVKLNGQYLGTLWCAPFQLPLGDHLKAGKNTLEIEVTNVAANRIADMDRRGVPWKIFRDANVLSVDGPALNASSWPVRDAGLIGPVTLVPFRELNLSSPKQGTRRAEPERLLPAEPERLLLSAQAEGLGTGSSHWQSALKGPFIGLNARDERAFQARWSPLGTDYPGLRPGLVETAFQAEASLGATGGLPPVKTLHTFRDSTVPPLADKPPTAPSEQQAVEKPLPTLFIIGDSTVRNGTKGQVGWGDPIGNLFDKTKIKVANRALGGRSSRTFITEGLWDKVLAGMKPGDFVLMQFGHNDGGAPDKAPFRGSLRGTGDETKVVVSAKTGKKEEVHTYGWYMRKYVADAKSKGATPIVLSQIPRNMWKDGKVVRASNDYGKWAAEAAKTEGALFVDLNEIVAKQYDKLGPDKVNALFEGDHTHTSAAGAQMNAAAVVEGIKELKDCPLVRYLRQ